MSDLTVTRLRVLLSYSPETGVFTRLVPAGPVAAGSIAGTPNKGAVQISVDGRIYRAHRLAWLFMTGTWPANVIDHRDGNSLNNIWSNLRDVTLAVNQQNQRRAQRHNTTGFLGVTYSKRHGKFQAQIGVGPRRKYLGMHASAEAAHQAYLEAKRTLHEGNTL